MKILINTSMSDKNAVYLLRLKYYLQNMKENNIIKKYSVNDLSQYKSSDLVVFQRIVEMNDNIFDDLFRYSKNIIYEIDDQMFNYSKKHPEKEHVSGKIRVMWEVIRPFICGITVSTDYLKSTFNETDIECEVVLNTLQNTLENKKTRKKQIKIGFMGTPTHGEDLKLLNGLWNKLSKEYGRKIKFCFVGSVSEEIKKNNIYHEFIPFTNNYEEFLKRGKQANIDIGLAPLKDNAFNKAKSLIKYLEYTYFNTVGIYSDILAYKDIQGGVVLKNNPDLWYRAIKELIDNPLRRNELLEKARQEIKEKYNFKNECEKLGRFYKKIAGKKPEKISREKLIRILRRKMNESYNTGDYSTFLEYINLLPGTLASTAAAKRQALKRINGINEEGLHIRLRKMEALQKLGFLKEDDLWVIEMLKEFEGKLNEDNNILDNDIYRIASVCKKINKAYQALNLFNIAQKKSTRADIKGGSFFHMGEIELKNGRKKKAEKLFSKTLKYMPEHRKANEYLKDI